MEIIAGDRLLKKDMAYYQCSDLNFEIAPILIALKNMRWILAIILIMGLVTLTLNATMFYSMEYKWSGFAKIIDFNIASSAEVKIVPKLDI